MNAPVQQKPGSDSMRMLVAMVGIGLFCGLMIVLTYEGTKPRIERLKAEALERAIFRVVPGTTQIAAFSYVGSQFSRLDDDQESASTQIYGGYNEEGKLMGLAIEAAGQGYADIIRILYGYDPAQQAVVGFYVLETKETPGLGDKIEKDPVFLANFEALDVSLNEDNAIANAIVTVKSGEKTNPWEVDGITGATISSRAIGDILAESTGKWVPAINGNIDQLKLTNE